MVSYLLVAAGVGGQGGWGVMYESDEIGTCQESFWQALRYLPRLSICLVSLTRPQNAMVVLMAQTPGQGNLSAQDNEGVARGVAWYEATKGPQVKAHTAEDMAPLAQPLNRGVGM